MIVTNRTFGKWFSTLCQVIEQIILCAHLKVITLIYDNWQYQFFLTGSAWLFDISCTHFIAWYSVFIWYSVFVLMFQRGHCLYLLGNGISFRWMMKWLTGGNRLIIQQSFQNILSKAFIASEFNKTSSS